MFKKLGQPGADALKIDVVAQGCHEFSEGHLGGAAEKLESVEASLQNIADETKKAAHHAMDSCEHGATEVRSWI